MGKEDIEEDILDNLTADQLVRFADEKFADIVKNGEYKRIVDNMAKLEYSVRNAVLVMLQNDNISQVKSMSGCNFNGRAVVKGSQGIKIVAPVFSAENKNTGYKISYVFDKSQTKQSASDKKAKQFKCDKQFIITHFEKIKEIIAKCADGYEFSSDAKPFEYDTTKKLFVDYSLEPNEVIATMISSIAEMKAGVEKPEPSDEKKGLFKVDDSHSNNLMTASVIAYMACNQLGIGEGVDLYVPGNFNEYTDDDMKKLAKNLNYAKAIARSMVSQVEGYGLQLINNEKNLDNDFKLKQDRNIRNSYIPQKQHEQVM